MCFWTLRGPVTMGGKRQDCRLELIAHRAGEGVDLLHAPYRTAMLQRVLESLTAEVDVRLTRLEDGREHVCSWAPAATRVGDRRRGRGDSMNAASWLEFQRRLTGRLLAWGALSMAAGLMLQRMRRPFWRAFGVQFAAWGAIDSAIALAGRWQAERKTAPQDAATVAAGVRKIRRLLWANAGLDVLYVCGGLWLALGKGRRDETARGHGWAVAFQGAFLFVFDLVHGWRLRQGERNRT